MGVRRVTQKARVVLDCRGPLSLESTAHQKDEALWGDRVVDHTRKRYHWGLALAIIATLGIATITIGTRWGSGLSPDSAVYIGAARSMMQGQGVSILSSSGDPIPMTHYPPLFPALLAACGATGADPVTAARWLNTGLFAANILLVGILVRVLTGSDGAATLASFLMYSSIVSLTIHSMAWSEPAFIFFGVGGLCFLAAYLQSSRRWLAVAGAGAVALSFLARYTGAAFVGAGVLGVLLLSTSTWNKRWIDAACFCAISCTPIILWLGRNRQVAGTMTNRNLVLHLVTVDHLRAGIGSLAAWLLHSLNPLVPRTVRGIAGTVVGCALLGTFSTGSPASLRSSVCKGLVNRTRSRLSVLPQLLGIFVSLYMVQLVISISLFDAHTPLSNRILSPVYVAFVIILPLVVQDMWEHRIRREPRLRTTVVSLCVAFCAFSLVCTAIWTTDKYARGSGYATPAWYDSEIIELISGLDPSVRVVTNAPDAIQVLTGKPAEMIPAKANHRDRQENHQYTSEMEHLEEQLRVDGGFVVYFDTVDWRWYLPSHAEVREELSLFLVRRASDGAIYQVEE